MRSRRMRSLMGAASWLALSAALNPSAESKTRINAKDGLTYVWISPGTYIMGCRAAKSECFRWELPARPVTLRAGFWTGQTEVTQEAYRIVIGKNPSRYRGSSLPVDQVSWFNARAYCEAIGMRLPAEAEWEYAARGGATGPRYASLDSIAWYDGNSHDRTHPVAQKNPNAFGLYDMLGNLWEWVDDRYEADPSKRMLRGGSFYNLARDLRVSNRLWASPQTAHRNMGFRCAGN